MKFADVLLLLCFCLDILTYVNKSKALAASEDYLIPLSRRVKTTGGKYRESMLEGEA